MERDLAQNYSFDAYLISRDKLPHHISSVNNTHVINTVLVPNDPADVSRNLYGQKTINDIMRNLGHLKHHRRIDLVKLASTVNPAHMWEVLHFMIEDNLLVNIRQLHIAMYIGEH